MFPRRALSRFFILTQICLAAAGKPLLHEKRENVPRGWAKVSRVSASSTMNIRIVLTPRNIEKGHDWLMDISDPQSANFGQHWTAEQVFNTFAPDQQTVVAVQEWLSQSGVTEERQHVASSLSHISFQASTAEAEMLFDTNYHIWGHESGSHTVSCDEYFIPSHLKHAIDFVMPGTGFNSKVSASIQTRYNHEFRNRALRSLPRNADSNNCSSFVTPACIRQIYGITTETQAYAGNDLGLFEANGPYNQDLLNAFFTNLVPDIPNGTHPVGDSIDGGALTTSIEEASHESMLDLYLAYPIIYPQSIQFFNVYPAEYSSQGFLDDFLDAIDSSFCTSPGAKNNVDPQFPNKYWNQSLECGIYKPPNVISISYDYNYVPVPPPAYEARQCHEYLKLGLQGVSILVASGDSGALPVSGGCLNESEPIRTTFPADCPYVLSVGATQLGMTLADPEEAALNSSDFFSSGGGFSSTFARPSYQDAAIQHFFNVSKKLPASTTYNRSTRGFPDVAAVGQNIAVYSAPQYYSAGPVLPQVGTADGTSAAAPLMASLINRINGLRLVAGKKALGFLNPIFYGHPEMFTDISNGYNTGCSANFSSPEIVPAFYCVEGWDPVTGLGTPNFPKMVEYLTSLK